MATCFARIMVQFSRHPVASMYIVVCVGMCTTAASRRACPLMSDPSVNTHSYGVNIGVHGTGVGVPSPCVCSLCDDCSRVESSQTFPRSGSDCENVYVDGPGESGYALGAEL